MVQTTEIQSTVDRLTESALNRLANDSTTRFKQVITALVNHVHAFEAQAGGYGAFLGFGTEIADRQETMRSHELVMRDVAPHFQGTTARLLSNFEHVQGLRNDWSLQVENAQALATATWEAEKGKLKP